MKCSNCSYPNDAHTSVDDPNDKPEPGSISICFGCGQICVFNDDLTLRGITTEELEDLAKNHYQVFRQIQQAQVEIQIRNQQHVRKN